MRVSAFAIIGNGNATRSIGGQRGSQDHVWAELNTDNALGSDVMLRVEANVTGEKHFIRPNRRKTCWNCGYRHPDEWSKVCLKCAQIRQGEDLRKTDFAIYLPGPNLHTIVELYTRHGGACRVELAHGVTLDYALECVAIVEKLKAEGKLSDGIA